MILRPAFPDELGRAKALLGGHPVPDAATFLLVVKEQPVERILAAIPWWMEPAPDGGPAQLRFFLAGAGSVVGEHLELILGRLAVVAREQQAGALFTDFSLPAGHPRFLELTASGFGIAETDRHFSVPGDIFKERSIRLYQRFQKKIPAVWTISSLRGQNPEALFRFVVQHGLISLQAFQNYWKTGQHEHFEDAYSKLLLNGETIIGAFLVSQRGKEELHIHVEASAPEYQSQSGLISATLRHASVSQCAEGFPRVYTWRADSQKHQQTANTALRQGGTELPPRHFLEKPVGYSTGQA